jgi:CIC family chloride channel protein
MSDKNKFLQALRVWKKLPFISTIRQKYRAFLDEQRLRMAGDFDGLPQLSLLAILCGLTTGGTIILFRLAIENGAFFFTGDPQGENFESLSPENRFLLIFIGSILVGLIFSLFSKSNRQVGVAHVIERLTYNQGYLPFKNAVAQFLGAFVAIVSGQSVGREGPSVHLGATNGSIIGRYLKVPNNSTRTLVCCGVAAAISAGFNTPLAGVIFAMEVVVMEYTIIGFTPVIISAVTAATLARIVFGDSPAITVPSFDLLSLNELPLIALMGVCIGALSALFTQLTLFTTNLWRDKHIVQRTTLAGLIVGSLSIISPQIMGIGYDTVNAALVGQFSIGLLGLIIICKCLASATACGLGIPGGLIGPNLMIGACAGAAFSASIHTVFPSISYDGFYATLGMGAMMGATLQAPLAALIALLELTANQSIILPGMIAIISAVLTERLLFKKPSIYRLLMMARGLDYRNNPIAQALRRVGVASVMDRNIVQLPEKVSLTKAEKVLEHQPNWLVVLKPNNQAFLIPALDLEVHINSLKEESKNDTQIDLLNFPAMRQIASRATTIDTLQEAHTIMQREAVDIVYISGAHGKTQKKIYGIVTDEHIERNSRKAY